MSEFTFYNNNAQLTLSADGITYGYIGRAVLTALVQPGGTATFKQAGYSTYTIDWAADIIVALPLKLNSCSLVNITRSGNTHTITVRQSNGSTDAYGLDNQEATEVYVFGAPVPGTLSIANLFDVNGVVCADLSRQPLTYKGLVQLASGVTYATIPAGVSVPAILGFPTDRRTTSVQDGSFWIQQLYSRGWRLYATGELYRADVPLNWSREDGGGTATDVYNPVNALIVEVAGLN